MIKLTNKQKKAVNQITYAINFSEILALIKSNMTAMQGSIRQH